MQEATGSGASRPRPWWHRLLVHPAALVPALLVVVSAVTGWGHPAVFVALLGALSLARLATGFRLDGWIERGATAIAGAIGPIAFGIGHLLIVVPAHLVGRRRWARARRQPPAWIERPRVGAAGATRLSAPEPLSAGRGRLRPLSAVGVVTLVLVADLGIGWAWNAWRPRDEVPSGPPPTLINVTGRTAPDDPRAFDPAMGGVPWAQDYFRELNAIIGTYWPFLLLRNDPYAGEHLNGSGWTRESWQPPEEPGVDRPLLSFYGGSTTFGIGQRDQHTVPSEVARLAAADGYPVEVRNHGVSGYVSWQEMQLFELLSAEGERPLRAVFYDGVNDLYAQRQAGVIGRPSHTEVDDVAARLRVPAPASGEREEAPSTVVADESLWERYERTSAIARIVDDLRGRPAGAAPAQASTPSDAEVAEATVEVYRRSRDLIEHIGERSGVEPTFFWQPVPEWDDPDEPYRAATEAIDAPTISIADCLDGRDDVYLSDGHTNEEGAQLVARCQWEHLRPIVVDWYRDQGIERRPKLEEALEGDRAGAEPVAALPLTAAALGAGWQAGVGVPNALAACTSASSGIDPVGGPGFELEGAATARLTTSVLPFDDEAAAGRALQRMADDATRICLERSAGQLLALDGQVRWRPASPGAEPPGSGGAASWIADVRFGSIELDGIVRFDLVQRGADLVAVQVTSTDVDLGLAAASAAVAALGTR
jgi:hypothetical protein